MTELLQSLGIDWRLLIAQIFNFLFLFFVVYKFFAQPLNNLLEERKKKIEEGYKNREEAKKLIEDVKRLRNEILDNAKKEKEEILSSAYHQKEILIQKFMEEIEKSRKEFEKRLNEEKNVRRENFYAELKKELPEILEKLATKIFHNEKLNREFIERALNE